MEIVEIIIKWGIPFVLSTAASAIIAYGKGLHKRLTEKEKANEEREQAMADGLKSLLRAEIIRSHDKYIGQGYCPVYAKEALKRSYEAYHALGGNDVATKLYNDSINLPENPN